MTQQIELNQWITSYIAEHKSKISRYEIDLHLLKIGHDPKEIEAAWQHILPTFKRGSEKTKLKWVKLLMRHPFISLTILIFCILAFIKISDILASPIQDSPHTKIQIKDAYGVAYSPDGQFLAVSTYDGVQLLNTSNNSLIRTSPLDNKSPTGAVVWSPDGRLLAAKTDTKVLIWRISDNQTTAFDTDCSATSIAFSFDSTQIAASCDAGTIMLGRLDKNQMTRLAGDPDFVNTVAFSSDGQILFSGDGDGSIQFWQTSYGSGLKTISTNDLWNKGVTNIAVSPDGQTLIASIDQNIEIRRTSDGTLIRSFEAGTNGPVLAMSLSPDGKTIAITESPPDIAEEPVGKDDSIQLWDLADGKLIKKLVGHETYVRSIAFSPDGKSIASAGADNTVRIWPLK